MNRSGLLIGVAEDSGKMVGFGMDRFGGLSPGIVSPIILAIGEKGWDMCGLVWVTVEWQVLRSIAGKEIIDVYDRGLNVGKKNHNDIYIKSRIL